MDQGQWKQEEQRLQQVYDKVCRELERRETEVKSFRQTVRKTGRSIWEEADHTWQYGDTDAAVEVKQYMDALKQASQSYEVSKRQLDKLERLEKSLYFGRIDFLEKHAPKEEIYIGITSFFDEDGNILIYDWRAPISGIFYDFDLGPAYYLCPEGKIEGEVSLKRQYRINRNQLEFMLDTGMKIDDEILQEILSKNTDEKMRNIVNTIQKEQNRIIRDEDHQLLMVQGVAGSGKTSIALHRIAYLLYQKRDSNLTSGNILIFSPNTVFNDYISNVLPELGEENMQQTTFEEYLRKMTEKDLTFESAGNHMEYVLTAEGLESEKTRLEGIKYKSSMAFYKLLNNYVSYLETHTVRFEDLKLGNKVLVTKRQMEALYNGDYAPLPLSRRLEKLKQRLFYLIRAPWQKRLSELIEELSGQDEYSGQVRAYSRLFVYREFKPIREQIESMLQFDAYEAYGRLFKDISLLSDLTEESLPKHFKEICAYTLQCIAVKNLGYEDISAYIYLKGMLEGVPRMSHIRHVVIDEAQDYTPVQYGIFRHLFPGTGMTLLGDYNQAIHPLRESFGYEETTEILSPVNSTILQLTKGYRSTADIVNFTRHILKGSRIESIQRSGEKPQLLIETDEDKLMDHLVADVEAMSREGMESIGIICRTAWASEKLFHKIRRRINASLLTKDEVSFHRGITVLPVYLAKGLEFDGVVFFDADAKSYGREGDRKLFYTACTRALHKLHLYSNGEVSPFVKEIPEEFYERRE